LSSSSSSSSPSSLLITPIYIWSFRAFYHIPMMHWILLVTKNHNWCWNTSLNTKTSSECPAQGSHSSKKVSNHVIR
jgi:hypothetical protein